MLNFKVLEKLQNESYYWVIGFYALCVAGITHVFFLFLFLYLKITPLIITNIISIAIYSYLPFVAGTKVLETKNDSMVGWVVFFELINHAIIATVTIGSASGFQYYIYVLAFIPFFISTYSTKVRLIRFISVTLIALAIEIYGHFYLPYYHLDDKIVFTLHLMNIFVFLLILGCISLFFFYESEKYQDILFHESSVDPLTKLFNRRFIIKKMDEKFPCYRKNGVICATILIDIDFFKKINDTYGHNTGDLILVTLAQALQQNIRTDSIVSRWGGEEFLIACYVADKENLRIIMERLRCVVEELAIQYQDQTIQITITLGGAIAQNGEPFADLINRADKALYRGKENGRNRSVIDEESIH